MLSCLTCVRIRVTLWSVDPQDPLSMRFSRHEYLNGSPCPSPVDLSNPGIQPISYVSCMGRWVLYHYHNLGSLIL